VTMMGVSTEGTEEDLEEAIEEDIDDGIEEAMITIKEVEVTKEIKDIMMVATAGDTIKE
ncbi:hypothetical protein KI387_018111, partial [Taxus chinensis]